MVGLPAFPVAISLTIDHRDPFYLWKTIWDVYSVLWLRLDLWSSLTKRLSTEPYRGNEVTE